MKPVQALPYKYFTDRHKGGTPFVDLYFFLSCVCSPLDPRICMYFMMSLIKAIYFQILVQKQYYLKRIEATITKLVSNESKLICSINIFNFLLFS